MAYKEPPRIFYGRKITEYSERLALVKTRIRLTGTLRLLVFISAAVTVWICRDAGHLSLAGVIIAFAIPFIAMMVVHSRLFGEKEFDETMLKLCADELHALDYDFGAFDGAEEEIDTHHPFCTDLDLFGHQSLFQSINRTVTHAGKVMLIDWFKHPLIQKDEILKRQEAVNEMMAKATFRQNFVVTGRSCTDRNDDLSLLHELSDNATNFSQSRFMQSIIWLLPVCWLIVAAGCLWFGWHTGIAGAMLIFALVISNVHSKRISMFHRSADKMTKTLTLYSRLIEMIEKETFSSKELVATQKIFVATKIKASNSIRKLSELTGALDQRFSLAGIIINTLCMRDVRLATRLEIWLKTNVLYFDAWFDALARADALCSIGGFAFNNPDYIYPEVVNGYFRLEGTALGHPLLHRDLCVRNDVHIPREAFFLIITGANMAGKSTYLRTVGINFLLACMGLPVCARSMTVSPAILFTSLRTADSLTANESYFFAELKRLKMIIDRLQAGEKMFIVLDEILKGTNSKDKQQGSLALMKQLIRLNACGIIATHDLTLGSLTQEFPNNTRNYCFEANITGDKLKFSYKIREGIAQNMNASFLMKQMGITV